MKKLVNLVNMREELIDELIRLLIDFLKSEEDPLTFLYEGEGQISVNRIMEWIAEKN